jgi:hypothetical protein
MRAHTTTTTTTNRPRPKQPITMRICGPGDEQALRRLAGRDTARPLAGTILAAEIEGAPLAAICLETGRVVADPFSRTAGLVDLLRARAAQLERANDPHPMQRDRRIRRARARLLGPAHQTNP